MEATHPTTNTIEEIETNLIDLMVRLSEDEGHITAFIKTQLVKALNIYIQRIDGQRQKGHVSRLKNFKMKDLIVRAMDKLEDLEAREDGCVTSGKTEHEIKTDLCEIEKKIETIKADECVDLLKTIQLDLNQLEMNETTMDQEQEERVSILVLKLFLKSPPTKMETILDQNLDNLDAIIYNLTKCNLTQVSHFNLEHIHGQLLEIKKKLEILGIITEEHTTKIQIASEDCLKEVMENLNDCETLVSKLHPPTGQKSLDAINNRVLFLIKLQLEAIQQNDDEEKRRFLFNKGMRIISKLNHIEKRNEEVNTVLKSLEESEEKIDTKTLETIQSEIEDIDIRNSEVRIQKNKLLKRIQGLKLLETTNFLREIKEATENFKIYVQDFGFSKNVDIYNFRKEEILSLVKLLDGVSKDDDFIIHRKQLIQNDIGQVLEILEERATRNQNLFSVLDQLEHIRKKIAFMVTMPNSFLTKLKDCNNVRRRLSIIDNFDQRIIERKNEIYLDLHDVENKIYVSESQGPLNDLKIMLNVYEKIENFSEEEHQTHRNDLLILIHKIQDVKEGGETVGVLIETAHIVLEVLDQTAAYNKNRTDLLAALETSSPQYEDLLSSLKTKCKENVFFYKIIAIERRHLVDKATVELEELSKHLQVLKETTDELRPSMQRLKDLFSLKESVEDLPQELDSRKRELLLEVHATLESLDANLAKGVLETPKSEFSMQHYFKQFDTDGMDDDHLLQTISQRAQELDFHVKNYVGCGSSDCLEMQQNLVFLLEELDKLGENDDLLGQVEELNGYVNEIIEQLELIESL